MTLLCTIDENQLSGITPQPNDDPVKQRKAARAIIFNDQNQIALLYAERDGYHKLPGGGIEDGEDWKFAVVREAIEEVGCSIRLRPIDMGTVEEIRKSHALHQISFCCIADVHGAIGETELTEDEIADGITSKWVDLDEAIRLVKSDAPEGYIGHFIQKRDLTFLMEAKAILEG